VRQATVAAQIAGRVLEVRADAGQRVKQGELLMRIDVREAAGSDASARATLDQAAAAYERAKNLHAQKFISQAALDQAAATFKAAQGAVAASGAGASHGNALIALLLGIGCATLVTPREEEPQINVTMANVFDPLPGGLGADVEALVARPAEQVLSRIAGIEHVYSVSRPGMAVITVQYEGRRGPDPGPGAALRHHQFAQGLAAAQPRRARADRQAQGHRRRAHRHADLPQPDPAKSAAFEMQQVARAAEIDSSASPARATCPPSAAPAT
jgi:multidrug efflux pump subunit AcrA (membrane-fusion protein)